MPANDVPPKRSAGAGWGPAGSELFDLNLGRRVAWKFGLDFEGLRARVPSGVGLHGSIGVGTTFRMLASNRNRHEASGTADQRGDGAGEAGCHISAAVFPPLSVAGSHAVQERCQRGSVEGFPAGYVEFEMRQH